MKIRNWVREAIDLWTGRKKNRKVLVPVKCYNLITYYKYIRGVIGIECESLISIWRNKITEACKKGIDAVVRFQYSENPIFQWQLSRTGFAYPVQHRRMNFQRPFLLNPLKKHLRGRWGCRRRPLVHLFGDNFEKLKQTNFVWFLLIL